MFSLKLQIVDATLSILSIAQKYIDKLARVLSLVASAADFRV
jgi:hypothetical protein